MPRSASRAINASTCAADSITPSLSARSPPASSSALKLRMSYQARMRMPLLMVTARIGACGNTKRKAGHPNLTSSGTIGSKSWPSAPRPCSHSTVHSGAGPVSCSTASSKAIDSIGPLYGQGHCCRNGSLRPSPGGPSPQVPVNTYMFDGPMAYQHSGAAPVHATNSGGRPWSDDTGPMEDGWEADGAMVRAAYTLRRDDDDFSQPGTLVREVFGDAERDALVEQVAGSLLGGVRSPVLERAFEYWKSIDPGVGQRIEDKVRKGSAQEPAAGMGEA